jgi:hypothetical protein
MGYSRRELPDEHGTHGPDEPPKRKPFEEALSWLEDIVPEAEKLDIDAWLRYHPGGLATAVFLTDASLALSSR